MYKVKDVAARLGLPAQTVYIGLFEMRIPEPALRLGATRIWTDAELDELKKNAWIKLRKELLARRKQK